MESLPWDMIGVIIGGLSFLITLIVEWSKLGTWRRIIIALVIGAIVFFIVTLVAPLLFPSTPTATPTTNDGFSFSENFEDGSADGFTNQSGNWIVVSETNRNKVLEINSMDSSYSYHPSIAFGESSWKDFIFESRINIIDYSPSNDAPLASIFFRGNYRVAFTPYWKAFDLVSSPSWNIISGITFDIQKTTWQLIRVEANGSKINVFLNDKLVMSDTTSQESSGSFGFEIVPKAHVQFDDITLKVLGK